MKDIGVILGSTFLLIITIFFVGWYVSYDKASETFVKDIEYIDATLRFKGGEVQVALAETDSERLRGLSGQRMIRENEGLLFVFNESAEHGIWMRDMYFPIDIIWLDNELKVIGIKENATPESFQSVRDAEVFTPNMPARYVLEVHSGFVGTYNVEVEDRFFIDEEGTKNKK